MKRVGGVVLAWLVGAGLTACLISEPPDDPPLFPKTRPTIVHESVVPTTSRVLTTFPDKFVVPVQLVDLSATFFWRMYVDYNPQTGSGLQQLGQSVFDPNSSDRNLRLVEVALVPPSDVGGCHVIEMLVASGFADPAGLGGRQAHTFDANGGDSAVWFYAPSGDTRACAPLAGFGDGGDAGDGESGTSSGASSSGGSGDGGATDASPESG